MSAAADEERFNKLLDEYRTNRLQYVSTQRPEYKKAADIAEGAVQDMLTKKQGAVNQQRKDMQSFASSYEEGRKELFSVQERGADMRDDTQKLIDTYETSKQRYDAWSENPVSGSTVDYALGYGILWRVGILMLLLPVIMFIGFYNPQLYDYGGLTASSGSWFGSYGTGYGSGYGYGGLTSPYSTRSYY
jgi:hypothetical protein